MFLKFVFSVYYKTIENVVALFGDISSTDQSFARGVGPCFIGGHSHRFNLAVNGVLVDFGAVLERLHRLMKNLFV